MSQHRICLCGHYGWRHFGDGHCQWPECACLWFEDKDRGILSDARTPSEGLTSVPAVMLSTVAHGLPAEPPQSITPPRYAAENPRAVCRCGHWRLVHVGESARCCAVEEGQNCYCPRFRLPGPGLLSEEEERRQRAVQEAERSRLEEERRLAEERRREAAETLAVLARVGRAISLIFEESDTGTALRGALLEFD